MKHKETKIFYFISVLSCDITDCSRVPPERASCLQQINQNFEEKIKALVLLIGLSKFAKTFAVRFKSFSIHKMLGEASPLNTILVCLQTKLLKLKPPVFMRYGKQQFHRMWEENRKTTPFFMPIKQNSACFLHRKSGSNLFAVLQVIQLPCVFNTMHCRQSILYTREWNHNFIIVLCICFAHVTEDHRIWSLEHQLMNTDLAF